MTDGTSYKNRRRFLPALILLAVLCLSSCHQAPPTKEVQKKQKPKDIVGTLTGSVYGQLKVVYDKENGIRDSMLVSLTGVKMLPEGLATNIEYLNEHLVEGEPYPDTDRCRACLKAQMRKREQWLENQKGKTKLVADKHTWKTKNNVPLRYVYKMKKGEKRESLNEEVISMGLARAVEKGEYRYRLRLRFEVLEKSARKNRRGIHSCKDPQKTITAYRSKYEEKKKEEKKKEGATSEQEKTEMAKKQEAEKKEQTESSEKRRTAAKKLDRRESEEKSDKNNKVRKNEKLDEAEKRKEEFATNSQLGHTNNKNQKEKLPQSKSQSFSKHRQKKTASTEPRIYARGPGMNNHSKSRKKLDITKKKENEQQVHFKLDFGNHSSRKKTGWFLFRLDNIQDMKVRIDLTNIGRYDKWTTLVPMYSKGVNNMYAISAYNSRHPNKKTQYTKTRKGFRVPKTRNLQKWHYFRNVEHIDETKSIILRRTFRQNRSYVSMRTPMPFRYIRKFARLLEDHPGATIHEIGTSQEGRPLFIIQVGGQTESARRKNPCVIMHGKEHPDEADSTAAVTGALSYLLSDRPSAKDLRSKATVFFIPVLDPDGSAWARYNSNICYHFEKGKSTRETRAYARFFRQWAKNYRLDVTINLHNVESSENGAVHLFNYLLPGEEKRKRNTRKMHKRIVDRVDWEGYNVRKSVSKDGYTFDRLAGFLQIHLVGTRHLFYEINSQGRPKLTLSQLRMLGWYILEETVNHLYSPEAKKMIHRLDRERLLRQRLIERYHPVLEEVMADEPGPYHRESLLWFLPELERTVARQEQEEKGSFDRDLWVLRLWRMEDRSRKNIPRIPQWKYR